MATGAGEPIVVYPKADSEQYEGRTDAIYIAFDINEDEGFGWFELPQFGIEVCAPITPELEDMAGEAVRELVQRLLAFYVALSELPQEYITEVETEQAELINRFLLPWIGRTLGRHPEHVCLPSDALELDRKGCHLISG